MKPEIIQKQTVAETKHLNLIMTSYRDKKGNEAQWVFAERPNNLNAAVIVAAVGLDTKTPKLVVTKEYRVPLQGYEYGLPAGLIEVDDQTVLDTAERELREETGLKVKRLLRSASPPVFNSAGLTNEACILVFVEAEGTPHSQYTEDSEDIQTELLSQAAVQDLMKEAMQGSVMIGAKAWLIMERFVKHGEI